ncbi:hypothetical protein HanRHA438_Chr17g0820381 [Helianthus annuus]|nr:hypothetical protein HanRHA438_Chr17g0820381 [Helianthus annuus]
MDDSGDVTIDVDYEFSAPKFFDFIEGETEEEMRQAQLWFDTALTHAPSLIKALICTRSKRQQEPVQLDSLCDFTQTETSHNVPSEAPNASSSMNNIIVEPEKQSEKTEHDPADKKEDVTSKDELKKDVSSSKNVSVVEKTEELKKDVSSSNLTTEQSKTTNTTYPSQGAEVCTPKPQMASQKNKNTLQTESKKQQTARRIASAVKNPSLLKSQTKSKTPAAVKRDTNKVGGTPNLAQENQAIKRQKLEGGKTRQILNIKTQILPHKARPGFVNGGNATTPAAKSRIEERKMYVREQAPVPFVSMAEMMRKFQSGTRDLHLPPRPSSSLSQQGDHSQVMQTKPKLKLTRPKEPSFETSQRVRSVKLKVQPKSRRNDG